MYRSGANFIVIVLLYSLVAPRIHAQSLRSGAPQAELDVMEKTIPELQAAMEAGTVTARRLVEMYQDRIAVYDKQGPAVNAMIALNPEALAAADERGARSEFPCA